MFGISTDFALNAMQGIKSFTIMKSCCRVRCRCLNAVKTPEWVTGFVDTAAGRIPVVTADWSRRDRLGRLKCRLFNSFRMNYTVEPGIYALGSPDGQSPVLVTANYKLSFDSLRGDLAGLDGWIVVLDTRGINVWCAAGKGAFGTEELIRRIRSNHLAEIVEHRRIILPQLGAPGVWAHMVREQTEFSVEWRRLYWFFRQVQKLGEAST